MAIIVVIDHETGNLDEYDTTVVDGGDLSVHSDAALAGTDYGLALLINDANSIWAEKNISLSTNELRWRVFLDPDSLMSGTDDKFDWFQVRLSSDPNIGAYIQLAPGGCLIVGIWAVIIVLMISVILIAAGWTIGGVRTAIPTGLGLISLTLLCIYYVIVNPKVAAFGVGDDGTPVAATDWISITYAEHCLEFHLERASSEGAEDGRLRMWIDGHLEGTANNLDNYDLWSNIAALRMGVVGRVDASTFGILCLDGLKANDDGSVIGCPVMTIGERIRRCLCILWRRFFWIPSLEFRQKRMV